LSLEAIISYLRRKDREYVTLDVPKLSALLSGTPRQIQSLIPDAENGLFSRFIFYFMNIRLQWMDVFACNEDESLDQRFDRLGDRFFNFYGFLKKAGNIRFSFSHTQQTAFNEYFEKVQQQYWELLGSDYLGSVRRLGYIVETYQKGLLEIVKLNKWPKILWKLLKKQI